MRAAIVAALMLFVEMAGLDTFVSNFHWNADYLLKSDTRLLRRIVRRLICLLILNLHMPQDCLMAKDRFL